MRPGVGGDRFSLFSIDYLNAAPSGKVFVKADTPAAGANYLARHEFLIRRLHSLSGLVPVGAYMVIHLLPANVGFVDALNVAGKMKRVRVALKTGEVLDK